MKPVTELEKKVLCLIQQVYGCDFINPFEVIEDKQDDITRYIIHLYLHDLRFGPLTMAYECKTEEEFLTWLKKELEKRNLIRSDHYKIQLHGKNHGC